MKHGRQLYSTCATGVAQCSVCFWTDVCYWLCQFLPVCQHAPMATKHRKKIRHFEESRHLHELTFSCYQRRPLLTNDLWRGIFASNLGSACIAEDFLLIAFVIHARARSPARLTGWTEFENQPTTGSHETADLEGDPKSAGVKSLAIARAVDSAGASGQILFSLLAGGTGIRSQHFHARSDFGIDQLHPRESRKKRPLPTSYRFQMVKCPVSSRPDNRS